MAESLVGREVGQYRVLAELARGQHSVVYKAWQPSLERNVALKVLGDYDHKTLAKFQDEARLTAQLIQQGVPNIRQVYEVGQTPDGYLFVALEYVHDSLHNVLRRARERNRRMNPRAAAQLLQPIAEALDAIHRLGWVHLDVKPQNILIARGGRALLADFGIARRQGVQTHACTPAYASPEQAAGDRPVGPWSDIYSLGVVLYEMVAGHPPVRGDHDFVLLNQHLVVTPPSPRRVNPTLSLSQERALYRALAKSPQERFRTAGEFLRTFSVPDSFLSSVVKTPGKLQRRASRATGRIPGWALAGGLLLLLLMLLALAVWALWPGFQGGGTPTGATAPVVSTAVPASPELRPSATSTRRVILTATATATRRPTVTLAPTPTWTSRPAASATPGLLPSAQPSLD